MWRKGFRLALSLLLTASALILAGSSQADVAVDSSFREEFRYTDLDGDWTVIRKPLFTGVKPSPCGYLSMEARPGGLLYDSDDAEELLLRSVPFVDYEVTTAVEFEPTEDFEMAGLLIYEDDSNFVMLGRGFCSACGGNQIYMDCETGGTVQPSHAVATSNAHTAFLKIAKRQSVFYGYYSEDGEDWLLVGEHSCSGLMPQGIGLAAFGGQSSTSPSVARFDFLEAIETKTLVAQEPAPDRKTPGTLDGELLVGDRGEAAYTIPIDVPAGINGLEPAGLAIAYDSGRGSSLLGTGFYIAGLGVITRCGRDMARDGVRDGVGYDESDRFALDGTRLVVVSGSSGADRSVYRTDPDTCTKIMSRGSAGVGPAWFEVYSSNGLIYSYGGGESSNEGRIYAAGQDDGSVRAWALSEIRDRFGNRILYNYDVAVGPSDLDTNSYRIASIEYGGDATCRVAFEYLQLDTRQVVYEAGSGASRDSLLSAITTSVGGQELYRYELKYEQSSWSGESILVGVTKVSAETGEWLPATQFSWPSMTSPVLESVAQTIWSPPPLFAADDAGPYILQHPGTETNYMTVYGGSFEIPGDFDGDGRTDLVVVRQGQIDGTTQKGEALADLFLSDGLALELEEDSIALGDWYGGSWFGGLIEANEAMQSQYFYGGSNSMHKPGDYHLTAAWKWGWASYNCTKHAWTMFYECEPGGPNPYYPWHGTCGSEYAPKEGWWRYWESPTGESPFEFVADYMGYKDYLPLDANADGRTDLAVLRYDTATNRTIAEIFESTGASLVHTESWDLGQGNLLRPKGDLGNGILHGLEFHIGDVDGDGRDDILGLRDFTDSEWALPDYCEHGITGPFFEVLVHLAGDPASETAYYIDYDSQTQTEEPHGRLVLDLNGDGLADILSYKQNGSAWAYLSTTDADNSPNQITGNRTDVAPPDPFESGIGWDQYSDALAAPPVAFVREQVSTSLDLWGSNACEDLMVVADVNGDGLDDVVVPRFDCEFVGAHPQPSCSNCQVELGCYVSKGNGSDFALVLEDADLVLPCDESMERAAFISAELNGDGKADFIYYDREAPYCGPLLLVSCADGYRVTDQEEGFTGANPLGYSPSTYQGWNENITSYNDSVQPFRFFCLPADIDGDGLTDIVAVSGDAGAFYASPNPWSTKRVPQWLEVNTYLLSGGNRQLVTGIENGYGASISIEYSSMATSGVHSRRSDACYPDQDVQLTTPVVS